MLFQIASSHNDAEAQAMVLVRVTTPVLPASLSIPNTKCLPLGSTHVLSTQEEQVIIDSLSPSSPAGGFTLQDALGASGGSSCPGAWWLGKKGSWDRVVCRREVAAKGKLIRGSQDGDHEILSLGSAHVNQEMVAPD